MVLTSACHDKPAGGPAERAGKKIDHAVQDLKQGAAETKKEIKEEWKK